MRFISNIDKNHSSELNELINNSDEIWMAVAFLKESGLRLILPALKQHIQKGKAFHIVVGQNFALTEPRALTAIYKVIEQTESEAFLANAIEKNNVFHPKLYLFRKGNDFTIISGSANLTGGGLSTNTECSLLVEAKQSDKVWKEALLFLNKLMLPENSQELDLAIIKQYETFYENQKKHNSISKAIPLKSKAQIKFNQDLIRMFKEYNNENREAIYRDKMSDYSEAKKVLDKIADHPKLTQSEFQVLLDRLVGSSEENNLWHSGSLYRLRRKVYPYYKEFQSLVKFIRSHSNETAASVFSKAKEMVGKIEGAGPNYISEIMMTYNPKEFANFNVNPLTVLIEKGGLNLKSTPITYTGIEYQEFCEIVKDIRKKLGIRNMLEADSFFNYIYWKI